MTFAPFEYNNRAIVFITHTAACTESINDEIDLLIWLEKIMQVYFNGDIFDYQ